MYNDSPAFHHLTILYLGLAAIAKELYPRRHFRRLGLAVSFLGYCTCNILTRYNFHAQRPASFGSYAQRHVHPRIFSTFDTKRDGSIDFEEYLCGVTVFRSGSVDDKLKCMFAHAPSSTYAVTSACYCPALLFHRHLYYV